jgi:hypothetical protein
MIRRSFRNISRCAASKKCDRPPVAKAEADPTQMGPFSGAPFRGRTEFPLMPARPVLTFVGMGLQSIQR